MNEEYLHFRSFGSVLGNHGFAKLCSAGGQVRTDGIFLLGVDGREIELIDGMIFIDGFALFGLQSADDPIAPFLGFRKGVEPTCRHKQFVAMKDDLYGRGRGSFATMNDLCSECFLEAEIVIV